MVFGEQPSAAKWNILGTNDASFNDGTGLPLADAEAAYVSGDGTTNSTSYTDASDTSSSDGVTVTVGANGLALVSISARISNTTANAFSWVTVAVSGATTIAADDKWAMKYQQYAANSEAMYGVTHLFTGLTPGSTTFKMKYKVQTGGSGAGTAGFNKRHISAIPL